MVLTNPYLMVNSVDLTASVRSAEPSFDVDQKDATVGSSTAMKKVEAGLEGWTIRARFKGAFGAGSVHETLKTAHKTVVAIEFRYSAGAVSTTNPKLTGNALVLYRPAGGAVGDFLEAEVELVGDGAYTWATA